MVNDCTSLYSLGEQSQVGHYRMQGKSKRERRNEGGERGTVAVMVILVVISEVTKT